MIAGVVCLSSCKESAADAEARLRAGVAAQYPQALSFGSDDDDTNIFAVKLAIEIQAQIAAKPEQLYSFETEQFDISHEDGQDQLSITTEAGDGLRIRLNENQLAQIVANSPAKRTGAKYVLVFSLSSASVPSLSTTVGDSRKRQSRLYSGVATDVVTINPGELSEEATGVPPKSEPKGAIGIFFDWVITILFGIYALGICLVVIALAGSLIFHVVRYCRRRNDS